MSSLTTKQKVQIRAKAYRDVEGGFYFCSGVSSRPPAKNNRC